MLRPCHRQHYNATSLPIFQMSLSEIQMLYRVNVGTSSLSTRDTESAYAHTKVHRSNKENKIDRTGSQRIRHFHVFITNV